MDPLAEVNFDDRLATEPLIDVDEQCDVDRVPVVERDVGQYLPPEGEFAGQRLGDPGKVGKKPLEQRTGDKLGHPPALAGPTVQWALIAGLHHHGGRLVDEWGGEGHDEPRWEIDDGAVAWGLGRPPATLDHL